MDYDQTKVTLARFAPRLAWCALVLLIPLTTNLVSTDLGDWYGAHRAGYWVVCVSIIAAWTVLERFWRSRKLANEFALFTLSDRLKPEDMGFAKVAPGISLTHLPSPTQRPYVDKVYVPRAAVAYDARKDKPTPSRNEQDLRTILEEGDSLLLIGQPTEGKSRTLYEVLKGLRGYQLVAPKKDLPSEEAFELLRDRCVVCVLDDVNQMVGQGSDVVEFCSRISKIAARTAIAASCRDGIELATLKIEMARSPLQRLYEGIANKLRLRPASEEEKGQLKRALNVTSDRPFPTLGAISMVEAFDVMHGRFATLPLTPRTSFWAIQLLIHFGLDPIRKELLLVVITKVFEHPLAGSALDEALRVLNQNGFVSVRADQQVIPETAYVAGPEVGRYYRDGLRPPQDDLSALRATLFAESKGDELLRVAMACWAGGSIKEGFELWRDIVETFGPSPQPTLRRSAADALFELGLCLLHTSLFEEACGFFNRLVVRFGADPSPLLREPVAKSLYELGITLPKIKQPLPGILALDALLSRFSADPTPEFRAHSARALMNKGVALGNLGRHEEARECFDRVIDLYRHDAMPEIRDQVSRARTNRASAIGVLDGPEAAAIECEAIFQELCADSVETVREQAARALFVKADYFRSTAGTDAPTTEQLQRQLDCYERIINHFADDTDPGIRARVASAKLAKAACHKGLRDLPLATSTFEAIIATYGADLQLQTRVVVGTAMSDLALAMAESSPTGAIEQLDLVQSKYGRQHAPEVRSVVAKALIRKALLLQERGEVKSAEGVLTSAVERYGEDALKETMETIEGARLMLQQIRLERCHAALRPVHVQR